jgi:integrase
MSLVMPGNPAKIQKKLIDAFLSTRPPELEPAQAVIAFVSQIGRKWSYRKSLLIHLLTALRHRGLELYRHPIIRRALATMDQHLLREVPQKAPLLTAAQLNRLMRCPVPEYAVPLALMLPAGARFADACRIQAGDIASIDPSGKMTYRVFQAKNIRQRRHQKWFVMTIPKPLLPALQLRWWAAPPSARLVTVTYRMFLRFLKIYIGDEKVSTYSIRRTVFEMLRRRVKNIEQMTVVTMHRNQDQLRWYLEAPLPDEANIQAFATAWHSESSY